MLVTTISSRELNQDVTRAKKASQRGPLNCTYIAESLAMPDGGENIDFNPPRLNLKPRPMDFS